MPQAPSDHPHILILAGAGGLTLDNALGPAATVTGRLSVVYLHAWGPLDVSAVRATWEERFTGTWRDCADLDEAYRAVREIHGESPLDGIATFSELLIQPQADLAAELGLPGNPRRRCGPRRTSCCSAPPCGTAGCWACASTPSAPPPTSRPPRPRSASRRCSSPPTAPPACRCAR
ncbi:hypothetical protein ACFQ2B_32340 [Streptomyces stramineus]